MSRSSVGPEDDLHARPDGGLRRLTLEVCGIKIIEGGALVT